MTLDVDTLIMEWIVTRGNVHDSKVSHRIIDSVRNFSYILPDSAYDTSDVYDYIFDNAYHSSDQYQ
ncbi:MAG: hypothetical protein OWQ34_01890 [Thermoplasma acidophilum]|nr:hypothetical protein [Thermoplasma acidophilum]